MSDEDVAVRLSLKGRRQFRKDTDDTTRDIKKIGDSASKSSYVANKAFGLISTGIQSVAHYVKRAVQGTVLAITGLSALIAKQAVQNLVAYEQAEVSFTRMLDSQEKARGFLGNLEQFAKNTPFEMPGVIDASRRMMAYGYAAEEVIPMLTAVGNAASGLGLGEQGIQRITTAIGQMKAKGTIQAEEFRQLAEAGIPAWDLLAKKIGVSIPEAMKMVERRMVPSSVGINAVMEGMNNRFSGMMEEQAKTIGGLWAKLKDTIGIEGRKALMPLQDDIKAGLRGIIALAERFTAWSSVEMPGHLARLRVAVQSTWDAFQVGGVALASMNVVEKIFGTDAGVALGNLITSMKDVWTVLTVALIPAIGDAASILPAWTTPLGLASMGLAWMARNAEDLRPILTALIVGWAIYRTTMLGVIAVQKVQAAIAWLQVVRSRQLAGATVAQAAAIRIVNAVTKAWVAVQWLINAALTANPIGLLVVAIGLLIAGIVYAYRESETFRNIVDGAFRWVWGTIKLVFKWLWDNWKLVLGILTGPIGMAVYVITQHWDTIVNTARRIFEKIREYVMGPINDFIEGWNKISGWFSSLFGGGDKKTITVTGTTSGMVTSTGEVMPPRLHSGGYTRTGGTTIIKPDEEAIVLPAAATVAPLPVGERVTNPASGGPGVAYLVLDGKIIASSTFGNLRDTAARR